MATRGYKARVSGLLASFLSTACARAIERSLTYSFGLLIVVLLGSCTTAVERAGRPVAVPPSITDGPAPAVENARAAGVSAGPAIESQAFAADVAALVAFRLSCSSLVKRADVSGLVDAAAWEPACRAAESWPGTDAPAFFVKHFEAVQVGNGSAFATGYFEPRISGSRTSGPGYQVPVYGVPGDLVQADLGLFSQALAGRRVRGRIENKAFVPYYDRAAIEDGALAGRGLEIAWAADPIDLFFLEIQGSGQLALPDGSVMRIGYAGQNGREYVAIGKLLKERGLLSGGVTMQAIAAWLRGHPAEGRAIMRENKSYIFFSETLGPGPLGALGIAVTPRVTVAADPRFVPLGAPVLLETDRPEVKGIWIAQDTGGAIKGPNRFDTFWGAGEEAARIAGGMSARGRSYLLLPKGSVARLKDGESDGAPTGR